MKNQPYNFQAKNILMIRRLSLRLSSTFSPVNIDYSELLSNKDLSSEIAKGFGPKALGIISVSNVPDLLPKRIRMLSLASQLANLPKVQLEKLEKPEVGYSVGWSHGKEMFQGQPDFSKGSFYANPQTDEGLESDGFYANNVWPQKALPDLRPAFLEMGNLIINVGKLLVQHIDTYLERSCKGYQSGEMKQILTGGQSHLGRLLHYFPQSGSNQPWCGWHNDHGALTGLTCALYIDEKTGQIVSGSEIQDSESGLFIQNREGEKQKARVKEDLLLFQIGETAQIVSGGMLQATPHAVMVSGMLQNISRNTIAIFMEPKPSHLLVCPDKENVFVEHEGVPSLKARWTDGMTFGDFHRKTINHYQSIDGQILFQVWLEYN